MHILVGIGAAVALLYFWLAGNWFARALMFLGLTVLLGFLVGGAMSGFNFGGPAIPGVIFGGVTAWFVSGIPAYYWRYQFTGSIAMPRALLGRHQQVLRKHSVREAPAASSICIDWQGIRVAVATIAAIGLFFWCFSF